MALLTFLGNDQSSDSGHQQEKHKEIERERQRKGEAWKRRNQYYNVDSEVRAMVNLIAWLQKFNPRFLSPKQRQVSCVTSKMIHAKASCEHDARDLEQRPGKCFK